MGPSSPRKKKRSDLRNDRGFVFRPLKPAVTKKKASKDNQENENIVAEKVAENPFVGKSTISQDDFETESLTTASKPKGKGEIERPAKTEIAPQPRPSKSGNDDVPTSQATITTTTTKTTTTRTRRRQSAFPQSQSGRTDTAQSSSSLTSTSSKSDLRLQLLRSRRSYMPPRSSTSRNDYTVEIPLAGDTPIIEKNRTMRLGGASLGGAAGHGDGAGKRRRSSLGLRGKRVSRNGLCPPPHETIEPENFYRHIDAEQSDPNRMRQLLVWCTERSMNMPLAESIKIVKSHEEGKAEELPELDGHLKAILRDVQKEVIEALSARQINTSWYHRPAAPSELVQSPLKKQPHPMNEANASELAAFQAELERLQAEESQWHQLLEDYTAAHPTPAPKPSPQADDPATSSPAEKTPPTDIQPAHRAILAQACERDHEKELDEWITQLVEDATIDLDATYDALAKTASFAHRTKKLADGVFDKVLKAYEEKEKRVKPVDTMGVLSLLSRC
ncbi:Mis12-Mtw1 protein family-domain-containing protein [Fimicolochytrium jonesii]|uniref:Mis12-Mtw1 protein family-domain-containing protein n=1 Tax=Fimicolochytrium jonesii TaxID=1396493 RepID=UPI0022FE1920|nr:Mis12-Mtw1 protein family-domain-containing protein [Fimicolochytrium jonesii]KAI8817687.1 Mis12-Mtw1 protein family-domain-containing protein [Fimicolochytrium jonesii]